MGGFDTDQVLSKGEYSYMGPALQAVFQKITRFDAAPGQTPILPGSNVVFYLDTWQFRMTWSPNGSPDPGWTRAQLGLAGGYLKNYLESGEGQRYNRNGVRVTARYGNQKSIFSLVASETPYVSVRHRAGRSNMMGSIYTQDRLDKKTCEALFQEAASWAKAQGLNKKIPASFSHTLTDGDVSLRLSITASRPGAASQLKFSDMVKQLSLFSKFITGHSQPGWAGCLVYIVVGVMQVGLTLEMAPGFLPLAQAAGNSQDADNAQAIA